MAHDRKHGSESFYLEGEGVLSTQVGGRRGTERDPVTEPVTGAEAPLRARPLAEGELPAFRFVRTGPRSRPPSRALVDALSAAMVGGRRRPQSDVPAGYTYLGQFVDHDLTMDHTEVMLGEEITPSDLVQGRSPGLDLDSLYGAGPASEGSAAFYEDDGVHLRLGTSRAVDDLDDLPGHDLPRRTTGPLPKRRNAQIPDPRNDENLAVAQTHVAMMALHNAVVDGLPPSSASLSAGRRFRRARRLVTLHYQWLLRHDFLPRICDPAVLDDVWTNGRRLVQPGADPLEVPAMPIEFSVAAFRLGHSMIRDSYSWNSQFSGRAGSLELLFTFSGRGGDLGGDITLPTSWVADWRRLYDFPAAGRPRLEAPDPGLNLALRIDTRLTDLLGSLPPGTFGGDDTAPPTARNLAFRNLVRGGMVHLANGQAMAERLRTVGVDVTDLTRAQLLDGAGGADLGALTPSQQDVVAARTPLWFYVLREAEVNGGVLTGVGARIVAETFHRSIEGSRSSIVREPGFVPTLGPRPGTFEMTDLLQVAFGATRRALAPIG